MDSLQPFSIKLHLLLCSLVLTHAINALDLSQPNVNHACKDGIDNSPVAAANAYQDFMILEDLYAKIVHKLYLVVKLALAQQTV